ncbi:FKBP-type peptidyl-prolyl cis-trans isomerase [Pseudonocardia sp. CA-142604]|uniref:FKBP-type peptidyl-prolyl cis-trans isomerase n=1 Tax=Pseudonocardia sp. CA-142604 TaxID=3240024 RepID=UPI003D9071C0
MRRSLLTAAAVVAVAVVAACGSPTAPEAPPAAPASSAPPAASAPAPAPGVPALTGNPTDLTAETQAQAGTGQPPSKLVTQDIVVGSGPAATPADTVDVQYTGTLYSNGTVFDSSWSRGEPATFPLNGVVPGFAQGIEGMQVGGRRVLVIPPALGYGNRSSGPIPGGSTLVFVVDLVGINT